MSKLASRFPFYGRKPSSPSAASDNEDTSLTTLLTPDQCNDVAFLVASITARMRASLVETFTAEERVSDRQPADDGKDKAKEEVEPGGADSESRDKVKEAEKAEKAEKEERKKRRDREENAKKELKQPETQELKKQMLRYFDEWRGNVVRRVGEVLHEPDEDAQATQMVADSKVQVQSHAPALATKTVDRVDEAGQDEGAVLAELYPPVVSGLAQLDEAKRALVLHSLVLVLLSLEHYSAHSRVLLLYLTSSLGLGLAALKRDEEAVARGLLEAADQQLNADAETKKNAEARATARKWKVGLASVAGAALIGVTGGLAAPFLAAGIGTAMGGLGLGATAAAGYLGTLAGSSVLVGSLFGAYGARMTGKAMDEYAHEVDDFAFVPLRDAPAHDQELRRLRVCIGISGWLTSKEDMVEPWRVVSPSIEAFALRWELEALLKLGNSMDSVVKSAAWSYAKHEIIQRTVFAALSAGLWPLGLLKLSKVLDNPFSVARARADKAGQVLADALINKVQGERPVTLLGYSLGARVIHACLLSLAARHAFGLVESAVLAGTAAPSDAADWRRMRSVVSGRLVNVFSRDDYILGFLYRTASIQLGVAGLDAICGVAGVQNVDVSPVVNGHLRYRYLTGSILHKVGFEDMDLAGVATEEAQMRAVEDAEHKEREKKREHAQARGQDDQEVADVQKEVDRKNQESMMGWAMGKMNLADRWDSVRGKGKQSDAERMADKEHENAQKQKT